MSDPTNAATPADTDFAKFAAEHLRDLKAYLQTQLTAINAAVASAVNSSKDYSRVWGANCKNNDALPNSGFDLDADAIKLFNPIDKTIYIKTALAVISNSVILAGPAVNGRDQAGAFAASSWIHFYWIYNPTTDTIASISSATPPPAGPSALPAGYTHWTYAGAIRFNASSQLVLSSIDGCTVTYSTIQSQTLNLTGSAEQTAAVNDVVPPNVVAANSVFQVFNNSGQQFFKPRIFTAVDYFSQVIGAGDTTDVTIGGFLPVKNATIRWAWSGGGSSVRLNSYRVWQYKIPNGGE